MKSYLDIVNKVLVKGTWKGNRTGVDTIAIPFVHFEHDMSEGFPLLTTKKMPIKTIAVELEGFIKGITDKQWYKERGCNIWNEWANPEVTKKEYEEYKEDTCHCDLCGPPDTITEKEFQKEVNDLGPIYGYQWRKFGEHYETPKGYKSDHEECMWPELNGLAKGMAVQPTDQLKSIVDKLHNNPSDRRMVCSAWNPNQFDMMALPPCHVLWNVVVIGDTLHLGWYQRSCDLMLGVPFNIASYAMLQMLLCKESCLKPGMLSGTLADCHIYENHIPGAKEQMLREPRQLPKLEIKGDKFDIFKWDHTQLSLVDYNPHPKIDFGGVAV